MKTRRVIVIGAGIGGLAAAIDLAVGGAEVVVLERAAQPGGKLRQAEAGGVLIDSGPTVFTMRWVFDELFARAGASLDDHVSMQPAQTLARHGWPDGSRLDLHADIDQTADAIGRFSGARDADGYRRFVAASGRIYETLEIPFIKSGKPSLPQLIARVTAANPANLWCIQPYSSLWRKLGRMFRDPRLRQLFARYSTYCGSSPFHAPATLMLIAHVERQGVWLVDGGMQRLAVAVAALAQRMGCTIRCNSHVGEILIENGRACGVRLSDGEVVHGEAVICNADVNAAASGLFGNEARSAVPAVPTARRSLSAMTWAVNAETTGFPLIRHNVFFREDYASEFADIFRHRRMPHAPTVYICAQDRGDRDSPRGLAAERLFCVVNAPAIGDTTTFGQKEIELCVASVQETLSRCGLRMEMTPQTATVTTPTDFNRSFPATGGALYGQASHGWMASFRRGGARSRIPGLYFAGGSVHPGAGLPMAALSGILAAQAVTKDWALQRRSHPAVTPGGMLTASAATDSTGSR
jgi:1-hydroxycarotenoid 3,4-desaturase